MGIIHWSIPQHLAVWAGDAFAPEAFIETGTNRGDTAIWAAEHFREIVTIEADPHLHDVASRRLSEYRNAEVLLGRSQEELSRILRGRGRCLIWLDAHWSGPGTSGEEHECPVLDEIRAVDASDAEHIVLIDDARLFLNAPLPPHKQDQWPSIGAVLDCLREGFPQAYITVWRDVIIRIPRDRQDAFETFCRDLDQGSVKELEELRAGLALAEARCEALLASTSWRITAPIRLLKAFGRAQ
jgi:hypothetical protein